MAETKEGKKIVTVKEYKDESGLNAMRGQLKKLSGDEPDRESAIAM